MQKVKDFVSNNLVTITIVGGVVTLLTLAFSIIGMFKKK